MIVTWSTIAKLHRLVDIPLLMALSGSSYGSITPGSMREDAGVAVSVVVAAVLVEL